MIPEATPYRFGDLLALARRSWVLRMTAELEARGFTGYRVSDAAVIRLLTAGPMPVGRLGAVLGVTRQAARKAARVLEDRGYASAVPDPGDARKVTITLTPLGRDYADAIREVIAILNQALAARVEPGQLGAADAALRSAIEGDELLRLARRIPPPQPGQ